MTFTKPDDVIVLRREGGKFSWRIGTSQWRRVTRWRETVKLAQISATALTFAMAMGLIQASERAAARERQAKHRRTPKWLAYVKQWRAARAKSQKTQP